MENNKQLGNKYLTWLNQFKFVFETICLYSIYCLILIYISEPYTITNKYLKL